jgi:hypothetical protein
MKVRDRSRPGKPARLAKSGAKDYAAPLRYGVDADVRRVKQPFWDVVSVNLPFASGRESNEPVAADEERLTLDGPKSNTRRGIRQYRAGNTNGDT